MIGKNTIKLIKSLSIKKYRLNEKLFIVEGDKTVLDVLSSEFKVEKLIATSGFLHEYSKQSENALQIIEASKKEIEQASLLKSPQQCIALCTLPDFKQLPRKPEKGLSIFLDEIQDPGNLGTIIRICDWFGIKQIFCSPGTVDVFNPKVIQASMGSFCRTEIFYSPFAKVFDLAQKNNFVVFGAFLDGEDLFQHSLPEDALMVLGNEGNGISKDVEIMIQKKLKIPSFNKEFKSAESLNVAMATAIICSEFKRQTNYPIYSK